MAAIRKANSESNVFGLLRQKANTGNTAERLCSRSAVFSVLAFCRNSPNTLLSELAFLIAATLDWSLFSLFHCSPTESFSVVGLSHCSPTIYLSAFAITQPLTLIRSCAYSAPLKVTLLLHRKILEDHCFAREFVAKILALDVFFVRIVKGYARE